MKRKRSSTVEPVWGTLINFTGMKRLNARGLAAANKMLLLAAAVYNLKKWLRFTAPETIAKATAMVKTKCSKALCAFVSHILQLITRSIAALNFFVCEMLLQKNKNLEAGTRL